MDAQIAAVARRQHGLVTSAQLATIGLSWNAVSKRAKAGRLHRLHRGVYAVGYRTVDRECALHAAVLAVGGDAALSHFSAALLWGLVRDHAPADAAPIDVITTRRPDQRRGIRLHFTGYLPPIDVSWPYGIPTTSPVRTLIDLASTVPERVLRRAVRQAEVERLVDLHALAARIGESRGRHGLAALRAIANAGPAPSRSELEDRTFALLQRHGLPCPLMNATVRTESRAYEVDFLFADQRVIVEADGDRYHGTRLARREDAAKQAALEDAGYRVVRLTWQQVTRDTAQTVRRLRRALG